MTYALVVDFGSQYTHLICKKIRELKRNCRIVAWYDVGAIKKFDYRALILSGGPKSVYEEDAPQIPKSLIDEAVDRDIKVMGICYGHQLIGKLYGGEVEQGTVGEYGPTEFFIVSDSVIFDGVPKRFTVWMNHSDVIKEPPKGFKIIGKTPILEVAAMEKDGKIFGIQFHPEVKHTEHGFEIIKNFIELANIPLSRTMAGILEEKIQYVREKIGEYNVALAASGGVDSTVLAALLRRALKGKIYAIVIDTGFMRENEVKETVEDLTNMGLDVISIDAADDFISSLIGVSDPEEKRKKFAKVYSKVLENTIKELSERDEKLKFFAQGTIYPDVVESGKGGVMKDKIKSHHNVVMPKIQGLEIVEPFWDLYKDEVRALGKMLGVPEKILSKKPFPGPGLAIRIIGAITREKIEIIRKAHTIFENMIKDYPRVDDVWQAFPVLLDSKSTGVKGDKRSYGYILAIRIVESEDGMTARFHEMDYKFLRSLASRLIGEIKQISRVVYDITDKPPATIEYE